MKRLVLNPVGWPCRLAECRPGIFVFECDGEKCVGFKSEYYAENGKIDAYNEGGEFFSPPGNQHDAIVQPVDPSWEDDG